MQLAFNHIGFFVEDLSQMTQFYTDVLQFTLTDAGGLGASHLSFLSRNPDDHHQIVLVSGKPAGRPFNSINQISFKVPDLASLRQVYLRLKQACVQDLVSVTHGNAISVYCLDPEGNRLEIFLNTPWYCTQPTREAIDIFLPDEEVLAQAEAIASCSPCFMPREVWKQSMAQKMSQQEGR